MVKMLPIKDFPGYYISKTGDVWSDKTNPIYAKTKKLHKIIPFKTPAGYFQVNLVKNKKIIHKSIHRLIVYQIKDGKIINQFYGTWEAGRETGIHQASISACCLGKQHHAGGYQWKYKQ